MGQILKQDKIGALSHNAGIITIQASTITIGGQQYVTSSLTRTIATDLTMAANTRYQIYAVVSGGVVALRISANENSVGPSGFTAWKLVGSLYSNGSSTFGSFVNTSGSPQSQTIFAGGVVISASTTNPTKATTTVTDEVWWKRIGDSAEVRMMYRHTSNVGAAAGSGNYLWNMPTSLVIDTVKVKGDTGVWAATAPTRESNVGHGHSRQQTTAYFIAQVAVWDGGAVTLQGIQAGTGSTALGSIASTFLAITAGTIEYGLNFTVPISGWSNTPIEDL